MQLAQIGSHLGLEVDQRFATRIVELRDAAEIRAEHAFPDTRVGFVGDIALCGVEIGRRAGVFASAVLHRAVHVQYTA